MGERDVAHVDVAALLHVADEYQAAADAIDAVVRTRLAGLQFGGAAAGRMHVARGGAVRAAIDGIADQLREWARASAEIAATLRTTAHRYDEADLRTSRLVG
ncbi:ESX-1 secretion-associated protein [Mycobacterium barrassiae]|uniref:type VII secretion target n=1 Tax=Mycobacterium barrassiae TaxID=319709 RepID=UPI002265E977|nr:type VII secretion target [Mycobacterium barrassiae]MCV7302416.1 ESX-1 secretion-associated protein [Mycobacterium barrassiae]